MGYNGGDRRRRLFPKDSVSDGQRLRHGRCVRNGSLSANPFVAAVSRLTSFTNAPVGSCVDFVSSVFQNIFLQSLEQLSNIALSKKTGANGPRRNVTQRVEDRQCKALGAPIDWRLWDYREEGPLVDLPLLTLSADRMCHVDFIFARLVALVD